jgi:cell division protein FtsX
MVRLWQGVLVLLGLAVVALIGWAIAGAIVAR